MDNRNPREYGTAFMNEAEHLPDPQDASRLPAAFKLGLAFAAQRLLPRLDRAVPGREAMLARAYRLVHHVALFVSGPWDAALLEVAAPLTGAAFEAALDLELLAADPSGERVRQALAFDAVQRHLAADKLAQFAARHPGRLPPCVEPAGEKERIAGVVREVWGFTRKGTPRFPEHWSALRPSQRLEALRASCPESALALEGLYRESWFRTVSARAGDETERSRALRWHRLFAFELMLGATATCARALDVDAVEAEQQAWLRDAGAVPGALRLRDEFARLPRP